MSKKARKEVEIMTTILKELGNFATQIYKNEKNIYVIHQMIKDIHVSFPYYQKDPWKGSFLYRFFSFKTWKWTRLNYSENVKDNKIWIRIKDF